MPEEERVMNVKNNSEELKPISRDRFTNAMALNPVFLRVFYVVFWCFLFLIVSIFLTTIMGPYFLYKIEIHEFLSLILTLLPWITPVVLVWYFWLCFFYIKQLRQKQTTDLEVSFIRKAAGASLACFLMTAMCFFMTFLKNPKDRLINHHHLPGRSSEAYEIYFIAAIILLSMTCFFYVATKTSVKYTTRRGIGYVHLVTLIVPLVWVVYLFSAIWASFLIVGLLSLVLLGYWFKFIQGIIKNRKIK